MERVFITVCSVKRGRILISRFSFWGGGGEGENLTTDGTLRPGGGVCKSEIFKDVAKLIFNIQDESNRHLLRFNVSKQFTKQVPHILATPMNDT